MKKTVKTLIAAFLALTVALCSIPAFAFQHGEIVGWEDEIGTYQDPYAYTGEMTEGTAYYEAYERANCCKLNVEKEGFYLFTYDAEKVSEIAISSSSRNGHPTGWADVLYSTQPGKALAYITNAETYAGFCVEYGVTGAEIGVEYYDVEISDIAFKDGAFDELIYSADFELTDKADTVKMVLDAEVTFENGEVFTLERGDFTVEADEDIYKGEYAATVRYHNYGEDATIDVKLVTDYIAKVEIENIEDYLYVEEYYNGEWVSGFANEKFDNEKITITYHNGTTQVIEEHDVYDYILLPNGRFYDMWLVVNEFNGEFTFTFRIANQNLIAEKCEFKKAGFIDNFAQLSSYIELHMGRIAYWFGETVADVFTGRGSLGNLLGFFSHSGVRDSFGYIFDAIGRFINYYAN